MIIRQHSISLSSTYPLERLGHAEDLLFFDIETTGFSGSYANLYLIGCTYYRSGSWQLIQWFADTRDSEPEILKDFFEFISGFTTLIHFNGDGFDLPFLIRRCEHYGFSYNFSSIQSFDIYKKIKPYRRLLGLDSLKQKSIEQFLGIHRKDLYNGGQLIDIYQEYLYSHSDDFYDLLILHNEDDLKGMPLILPILSYPDFFEHDYSLLSWEQIYKSDIFGNSMPYLVLTCQSHYPIPVPFDSPDDLVSCYGEENRLVLTVPVYQGCLKHYFTDYQNYYYLIEEDTAIHKSIGEYVDKAVRKKATARTCYVKKEGLFLPQFIPVWHPDFKSDSKDKFSYFEFSPDFFHNDENSMTYIRQLCEYRFGRFIRSASHSAAQKN